MKSVFASAVAVVAAASTVHADPVTQFRLQVSRDGVEWTQQLDLSNETGPTVRVFARASVSYIQNDGPIGLTLAGTRIQPTVQGWNASSDRVLPFEARSKVVPSYGAVPVLGRTFGVTTLSTSDQLSAHINDDVLRFAAETTVLAIGAGAGRNNIDGRGGVNLISPTLSSLDNVTDILLFTWGMDVDVTDDSRELVFDIPYGGINRFASLSESQGRGADWLSNREPSSFERARAIPTITARVTIPAPNTATVLFVGAVFAFRRRRPFAKQN